MNILEARIERADGGLTCVLGDQRLALGPETLERRPAVAEYVGRSLVLGIRPESLADATLHPEAPADRRIRGEVELREALGSEIVAHIRVPDATAAYTEDVAELARDIDVAVAADPSARHSASVVARLEARSQVQEDGPAELVVDTELLHFFDPDSGLAIYDEVPTTPEVQNEDGETTGTNAAVAAGAAGGGGGDGAGGRRLWRRRR
jgi:multiple sugar transport system ATP-binding protein